MLLSLNWRLRGEALMLTREEVERRLKRWSRVKPEDPSYLRDSGQRDALETALAAMDERDALAAEGLILLAAVKACERDNCSVCPFTYNELCGCRVEDVHTETGDLRLTPLIAAEAERVKRLEAVLEAAESEVLQCAKWTNTDRFDLTACDMCSMRKTCAALAAYQEGERPGGEV